MKRNDIRANEIIDMIPDEQLDFLAASTSVDYKVHKLTGRTMLELLLYSLISEHNVSLRVMEQVFRSAQFAALSPVAAATSTRFTSIRDRINTIDADYFQQLFAFCADRFNKQLASDKTLVRSDGSRDGSLIRFDSTMVALGAKLLGEQVGGMRVGRGASKTQIKFTIGFNGLIPTKAKVFTHPSELSEDLTIPVLIKAASLSGRDVAVFDRGVSRRSTLSEFSESGIGFVTRIKADARYEAAGDNRLSEPVQAGSLLLTEDRQVYLFGEKGTRTPQSLRLIRGEHIESGEPILFLSNLSAQEFSAGEVSELYRRRWDIEVFFKFLKRELDLEHLPVRSLNGIEVVLYAKLIAAMLLSAYKVLNGLEGYKLVKLRFSHELEYELMRQVVIICGGDPEKMPGFLHRRSFVQ